MLASRNLRFGLPASVIGSNYFYLSTNFGAAWAPVLGPITSSQNNGAVSSVAISADGKILFGSMLLIGNNPWIYISTNSGAIWSSNQFSSGFPYVEASANGKLLSVLNGRFLLTTTNFGATWNTNTLPGILFSWSCLASSADGKKLFVLGEYSMGNNFFGAILTSMDAGTTWKTNFTGFAGGYNTGVMTSSADGTKLATFAKTVLIISTNIGTSWTAATAPSTNWQAMASSADGNRLAATANGLFFSTHFPTATGGIWTSQTTLSPQLNLAPASANLTLAWTVPSTNFVLQQSTDLVSWSPVTSPPVLNLTNLQNQVTLTNEASSLAFGLMERRAATLSIP